MFSSVCIRAWRKSRRCTLLPPLGETPEPSQMSMNRSIDRAKINKKHHFLQLSVIFIFSSAVRLLDSVTWTITSGLWTSELVDTTAKTNWGEVRRRLHVWHRVTVCASPPRFLASKPSKTLWLLELYFLLALRLNL